MGSKIERVRQPLTAEKKRGTLKSPENVASFDRMILIVTSERNVLVATDI